MTDEQWTKAKEHLDFYRQVYTDIGSAGILGLRLTFDPLVIRFENGERTPELYDEMLAVE